MANGKQLTIRERLTRVETKVGDGFKNLGEKLDTYITQDREAGRLLEIRVGKVENKFSRMNGENKGVTKFFTIFLLILAGVGGVMGTWAAIIK